MAYKFVAYLDRFQTDAFYHVFIQKFAYRLTINVERITAWTTHWQLVSASPSLILAYILIWDFQQLQYPVCHYDAVC